MIRNLHLAASLLLALSLTGSAQLSFSAEQTGASTRRAQVFAFTQKPSISKKGDLHTISFETKDYCDVTVAVEGAEGRIVRHLASGVLGRNAPEPFQKNSLKQAIIWDGKDEQGKYVDNKTQYSVRVSLGLKARFERSLYWCPEKRGMSVPYAKNNSAAIAATPEGIYVHDGGGGDYINLFDHDGNYVRAVYPFSADKIQKAKGLKWVPFPPDNQRVPFKGDRNQSTLLTYGGGHQKVMTVNGKQMAIIGQRLNWLSTEGPSSQGTPGQAGSLPLTGPAVTYPVSMATVHTFKGGTYQIPPREAAFSPDGKWLYLTHFRYGNSWREGILPGVARVAAKGDAAPEIFLGNMNRNGGSAEPGKFNAPTSVACDAKGRIYVSDYLNDRIQVFSPEGKILKSIKVTRPAVVRVHPKSQEIYVFTWSVHASYSQTLLYKGKSQLTHLGPLEKPDLKATYALPGKSEKSRVLDRAALDVWSDPPRIWISTEAIKIYDLKDKKLVLKKDFQAEARKKCVRTVGPRHGRQRLYFNPGDQHLYVGEHFDPAVIHAKGFCDLIKLDPRSGKVSLQKLPFDCEDMAFDMEGHAYLRTMEFVARYDTQTWREVPFDYGEERPRISYQGFRSSPAISVLVAPAGGNSSSQFGGIGVSPHGDIALAVYNPNHSADRRDTKNVSSKNVKKYTPKIFPGRAVNCLIHVWDKPGKLIYEDAIPGVGRSCSVRMDRNRDLYLLANGQNSYGGKPYPNPIVCTLLKVKPGTKVLAGGRMPVPLPEATRPKRKAELNNWFGAGAPTWVNESKWAFGGVGIDGKQFAKCHCMATSQLALDYFGRSIVGETQRCNVVVVDSAGNAILRLGKYGNADDGIPMVKKYGPPNPRSIGGDEVSLFNPKFVATQTDRRIFIADIGNYRIVSVKLDYHAEERVALVD